MGDGRTTKAVQRYLDQLAHVSGEVPAEPLVRELMAASVNRLHMLCASMLLRSYPRLTRPPLNLQIDEMLGAVVERMLKALRSVKPNTVRQFFALANQHMRWELNDLARRLDNQTRAQALRASRAAAPADSSGSDLTPNARRILNAIDGLPPDEREAFDLVRIQGMSQPAAADVLGVSAKTVQRRLNRALLILADQLGDLQQPQPQPARP
ncbi:MAG TPA: sigma-70 family RNA polymerase sigma factor [Tepidisphaeraceae bacterium]|jgi:RNA polymerase sigma-70 factor (ECF subfamily)